jgi:hypothetical protein
MLSHPTFRQTLQLPSLMWRVEYDGADLVKRKNGLLSYCLPYVRLPKNTTFAETFTPEIQTEQQPGKPKNKRDTSCLYEARKFTKVWSV